MDCRGAHPPTQSRAQSEGGAWGEMPRILVVDDDVDAADALASMLQSAGHGDERVVYTGATALAVALKVVPTPLLRDLEPPDMSGYGAAAKEAMLHEVPGERSFLIERAPAPANGAYGRARASIQVQASLQDCTGRARLLAGRPGPTDYCRRLTE